MLHRLRFEVHVFFNTVHVHIHLDFAACHRKRLEFRTSPTTRKSRSQRIDANYSALSKRLTDAFLAEDGDYKFNIEPLHGADVFRADRRDILRKPYRCIIIVEVKAWRIDSEWSHNVIMDSRI